MTDKLIKVIGQVYGQGVTVVSKEQMKTFYINPNSIDYVIDEGAEYSIQVGYTKLVKVYKEANADLKEFLETNNYANRNDFRSKPRNTVKKQRLVEGE